VVLTASTSGSLLSSRCLIRPLEFSGEPLGTESASQGTHPQISSVVLSLQEDVDMSDISFDQSVQKGDTQEDIVLSLDEELSQVKD